MNIKFGFKNTRHKHISISAKKTQWIIKFNPFCVNKYPSISIHEILAALQFKQTTTTDPNSKDFTVEDMKFAFYAGMRRGDEIATAIAKNKLTIITYNSAFDDWLKDYLSIDKSTAITNDG